jgi:hypothetical protein
MMACNAGPWRSYLSIRSSEARMMSTQVIAPSDSAACRSATVASTTDTANRVRKSRYDLADWAPAGETQSDAFT